MGGFSGATIVDTGGRAQYDLRSVALFDRCVHSLGRGIPCANCTSLVPSKAIQPGLFEVAGPRVSEVTAAGIQSITATPGKGGRSIHVHSPWGDSFYGWPKNVKPVAFTIQVGNPAGGATISAPGFKDANKADYKAAIESIIPFAIQIQRQAGIGWTTRTTEGIDRRGG